MAYGHLMSHTRKAERLEGPAPACGDGAVSAYVGAVMKHLRPALERRLEHLAEGGRSLEEIGPADAAADRMLATIPCPTTWDDLLGPFYTTGQVAKLLGAVSRQAVADRRRRRTLLALRTADGVVVHPVFQFDEQNRVLEGLPAVLQIVAASGVDEWTLAGWLVSPSTPLEGKSPIEWLREGRDHAPLLALAEETSERFEQ